jgi:hypothetical protein
LSVAPYPPLQQAVKREEKKDSYPTKFNTIKYMKDQKQRELETYNSTSQPDIGP